MKKKYKKLKNEIEVQIDTFTNGVGAKSITVTHIPTGTVLHAHHPGNPHKARLELIEELKEIISKKKP